MVYNTKNYWGFGHFPSSDILETRKHDVSETGSVSFLRCLPPPLRTETYPVSETSCFLVSRISDEGRSPKTY
jgi:hypothetical protein